MLYTAHYKRWIFWHKVKNVKADSIIESDRGVALPVRVLILSDETRLEIPMSYLIKFSKERQFSIKRDIEEKKGGG